MLVDNLTHDSFGFFLDHGIVLFERALNSDVLVSIKQFAWIKQHRISFFYSSEWYEWRDRIKILRNQIEFFQFLTFLLPQNC